MNYNTINLTKEQKNISLRNNQATRKLLNVPFGYVLHHKDKNLRHTDVERYILWLPEDVEVLSPEEHFNIHIKDRSIDKRGEYKSSNKYKNKKEVVCIETGEVYESIQSVQFKTGISFQNIWAVINGRRKTAGGYHWKYKE